MEILRELTDKEVLELLQLYKDKLGIFDFNYLLLYNQCKWNKYLKKCNQYENININGGDQPDEWMSIRKTFYTHRNYEFRKYGTYVGLHNDLEQSVMFYSWQPNYTELLECLSQTHLIDWKSGPLITNVPLDICDDIIEMANAKGVSVQRARQCKGLLLKREQALTLSCLDLPLEYYMAHLSADNAEFIHSVWPNNKEGSLQYVKHLIEVNKTLGIFRKTNNELVAWIFQNDFAGLGILQVIPEEQRNGFGQILATQMSYNIAEDEDIGITAWVVEQNLKSRALLHKVGYNETITVQWIQLNPLTTTKSH